MNPCCRSSTACRDVGHARSPMTNGFNRTRASRPASARSSKRAHGAMSGSKSDGAGRSATAVNLPNRGTGEESLGTVGHCGKRRNTDGTKDAFGLGRCSPCLLMIFHLEVSNLHNSATCVNRRVFFRAYFGVFQRLFFSYPLFCCGRGIPWAYQRLSDDSTTFI
jgi:hypothetical protein